MTGTLHYRGNQTTSFLTPSLSHLEANYFCHQRPHSGSQQPTQGRLLETRMKAKVHPAALAAREGARVVLERVDVSFPNLAHLWAEAGYREADLSRWITERLGLSLEIVQRKPRWVWILNYVEPDPIPTVFEVIRRSWVVEHTFAWLLLNRRMSRDYEFPPETGEALIYVTMLRLMLKRLAKGVQ